MANEVGAINHVNLGNIGAMNHVNAGNIAAVNHTPFTISTSGEDFVTVSPAGWNEPAAGGIHNGALTLTTTGTGNWTTSTSGDGGVTLSPSSGSTTGDISIRLTFTTNSNATARVNLVTFTRGFSTFEVTLCQDGTVEFC